MKAKRRTLSEWWSEEIRPRKTLKIFTNRIIRDHEDWKKKATHRIKQSEKKLADFKKEFDGVEELLDARKGRKQTSEEEIENERLIFRLKEINHQNDTSIKKADKDFEDYEARIKADYQRQKYLVSKFSRNLAFVSILLLNLLNLFFYVIYKIFFPDFGKGVQIEYYNVIAQILPALLIALYFTSRNQSPTNMKDFEDASIWTRLMSESRLLGIYGFLLGEIACLVAVGRGWSGLGVMLFSFMGTGLLALLVFGKIIENRKTD